MKLAIFHTEFAYPGGAERMTFEQIDYLKKKGHKVVCFSAFVDRTECFPGRIKKYDIRQILPEFLNKIVPHDLMIVATTLAFPLFLFSFRNYNIFLGENHVAPWWAAMASLVSRKPYITYHNYPLSITYPRQIDKTARRNTLVVDLLVRIANPLIVFIDKLVVGSADLSFADGKHAKDVCKKAYGKNFVDCPGGAAPGEFNKKILNSRYSGGITVAKKVIKKPYILITNRHFPAKRLDFGIKVVKNLITNYKLQITLIITGSETKHTGELKDLAKKLKVDNQVIFTGLVDENELKKLYKNALVYIYTASEEDYGLGILEAASFGVPSVVWDKAGPSYLVLDGKTGYKVTPADINEFASKVERLIIDKDLNFRLARAAFDFSKNFSWDNHGKILEKYLRQTIRSQKKFDE